MSKIMLPEYLRELRNQLFDAVNLERPTAEEMTEEMRIARAYVAACDDYYSMIGCENDSSNMEPK